MWRRTEESKPQPAAEAPASVASVPVQRSAPVADAPPAGTVLSRGIAVKGEVSGREDVYLDGQFEGKVRVDDATVTVGPNGRVSAEIEARAIIVAGCLSGSLHAHELVQVRGSGSVEGDIVTQRLALEDGAIVRGRVEMTREGEKLAASRSFGTAAPAAKQPEAFHSVALGASKFAES